MSAQVDLLFRCTAFNVHERTLAGMLKILLEVNQAPISLEELAERSNYSIGQVKRGMRALAWRDPDLGITPVVIRHGGARGRPYRHDVIENRASELGLINAA